MPPPKKPTLTRQALVRATWAFGKVGQERPYAPQMRLFETGRLGGYADPNESRWELRDGVVVFLNRAGEVATTFSKLAREGGRLVLEGPLRGNDNRHYLREVDPVGALAAAGAGAKPVARAGLVPRRNLVVLCAGADSQHAGWEHDIDEADRNWDLCLSWHGDVATFDEDPDADYHVIQSGMPKFPGLASLLYEGSPFFNYDYVMFPDDDLAWSWRGVNTAFESMRTFDLMLGQPSLEPAGHPIHDITIKRPEWRVHYTNFVETMVPIFSRQALLVCAPSFGFSRSGFGLDHVWPCLLGDPPGRIGIIDDTAVVHTRPQVLNEDMGEAIEEGRRVSDAYGASWRYDILGHLVRGAR